MARVLVADDAVDIVRLLSCSLAHQGYDVSVAHNGRQALEVAAVERPDVILLDIAMPELDGLEVCRQLKADPRLETIPVILVTGRDREEDVVAGLDAGADDYVVKPFSDAILAARLRSAVRVKNSHDAVATMNRQLRAEVAERERAETEATVAKQRIEFILGATKTGLAVIDLDFKLVYVDPQWRKHYGDYTDKKCYEYFRSRTEPCADCPLRRTIETKQVSVVETVLPKEGNRPVQVTGIPFKDEQGQWLFAEVNVDVRERKRLEGELSQVQKLEAIGQLAAGIAHEINTPTQYIGDNTRFLQDAFADFNAVLEAVERLLRAARNGGISDQMLDQVEAALHKADIDYLKKETPLAIEQSLEGVGRVAGIVRAMKEFSHPGGDQKQAIDLNHAIENTLMISRNEWKYVAEVVTDLDPDLPPVPCLPGDLNQVILNVVVNAAQAIGDVVKESGQSAGRITVRTRHDDDHVEISVEDTGAGIPKELQSKVFDPFFTTKEVGKGTGQGLAIAHSIVTDKHGGTIAFQTEPGRGTTFIIRLPLVDAGNGEQTPKASEAVLA